MLVSRSVQYLALAAANSKDRLRGFFAPRCESRFSGRGRGEDEPHPGSPNGRTHQEPPCWEPRCAAVPRRKARCSEWRLHLSWMGKDVFFLVVGHWRVVLHLRRPVVCLVSVFGLPYRSGTDLARLELIIHVFTTHDVFRTRLRPGSEWTRLGRDCFAGGLLGLFGHRSALH